MLQIKRLLRDAFVFQPLRYACVMAGLSLGTLAVQAGEGYDVIAYDIDPVVQIDGDLQDWSQMPGAMQLSRSEQVTFGGEFWNDPDDLSGEVRVAWRENGLSISAIVTDDFVRQPYTGDEIYNGDHINLILDFSPQDRREENAFGEGQYHFAISPGSLTDDGHAISPEVYRYVPRDSEAQAYQVVARRTSTGYVIEAFIPQESFGSPSLTQGVDFNWVVTISDADAQPAKQQTMMTPGVKVWRYGRSCLTPVVLGDGNGVGSEPARGIKVSDQPMAILAGKSQSLTFNVDAIPANKRAHLFFKSRIDFKHVAGFVSRGLRVNLNGKPLTSAQLSNRPVDGMMMNGQTHSFATSDGVLAVWYTPTWNAIASDRNYRLVDGVDPCVYGFDVTELIHEGANELVLENLTFDDPPGPKAMKRTVMVEGLAVVFKSPVAEKTYAPAPTGVLEIREPTREPGPAWSTMHQDGSAVLLRVADKVLVVRSRFSAPNGQWYEGNNDYFTHERKVEEAGEWVLIRDTFTNKTDKHLPILQEHHGSLPDGQEDVYLAGTWMPAKQGLKRDGANPSVYASGKGVGLGLIALNDEMRVHVETSAGPEGFALADRSYVLAPGATYTSEWAIVPTSGGGFWSFVNRARRMMGVNFKLEILSGFIAGGAPAYKWTDEQLRQHIDNRSLTAAIQSDWGPPESRGNGQPAKGTAWAGVSHDYYKVFNQRIHSLYPDGNVKHGIYFHSFLDSSPGSAERFADARVTDASGEHLNYAGGFKHYGIYVPTLENSFGAALEKNVDTVFDTIGAGMLYWDEHAYSRSEYTYSQWDGCSGDIDPKTFKLRKLKGSVSLLSAGWRKRIAQKAMGRGWLLANHAPVTRTMAELHYPAFTETGSIANCAKMLLYSPVALGDHLTERTQRDAYRVMLKALDYGCVYVWYSTHVPVMHPTLTEHMYPITPIEIHEGYIIGEERIITNRSGLFGWGDDSRFEAYVYDRDGVATDEVVVEERKVGDKTYAEVRLPEGYSAALVRVKPSQ